MVQIGPEVHVQMESCRFFFRLTNRFSRAQIELCARKTKQNQTATKYEKHTRWCTDHVQERDEAARKNEELFNLMLFRVNKSGFQPVPRISRKFECRCYFKSLTFNFSASVFLFCLFEGYIFDKTT